MPASLETPSKFRLELNTDGREEWVQGFWEVADVVHSGKAIYLDIVPDSANVEYEDPLEPAGVCYEVLVATHNKHQPHDTRIRLGAYAFPLPEDYMRGDGKPITHSINLDQYKDFWLSKNEYNPHESVLDAVNQENLALVFEVHVRKD